MQSDSNSPYQVASTNSDSKPGKFLIPRSHRQRFFIQFTLMSILGWVVGGIASIALEKIILESLSTVVQQPTLSVLIRFISNVVFAVIFAADQALIIYGYLSGRLWIIATSAGWLITNSVSTNWINYISSIASSLNETLSPESTLIFGFLSTIAYIISGIWLGLCQWLVLRRYTTGVWWWSFLPSISFLFISILIWLLSLIQDLIPEASRTNVLHWSGQGFAAVILGVIPAIGLCTLKRNSHRQTRISQE
ncbi:hypothetical protein FNW02_29505 [Komarekiella sp. 'clone 1']|uniref:Uncharacterized protein n=1 Tax=Komarekiella delphini-convector SJRDD-AB1 TaxID=2593771 RepID=A0AA40VU44_9NOST|nr:hypothetical protein [Komarekiella delphini-convector]MBD6619829.1 hypothetical protein [Komarekiella delphini-convector SJRDD-AB1]